MSPAPGRPGPSCFRCVHRFAPVEAHPCAECLVDENYDAFEPRAGELTAREVEKREAAAVAVTPSKIEWLEVVRFLQNEKDRWREDAVRESDRAQALERRCDALEQKLADERQASDDQIRTLERRSRDWEIVSRGCGCPDPVWLLAAECLLLAQSSRGAAERYGWLIAERGDWHLSWNRGHVSATIPGTCDLESVGVGAAEMVARRRETDGAGSYLVGLCMWAGPMWAGECQVGAEAVQDLEAELRTWLEDLKAEGVNHG